MNRLTKRLLFFGLAGALLFPAGNANAQPANSGEIRLIVRGDDMGMAHSVNQACIRAYREGILTTVEVMVPCPWFPEAAKLLRENPGLDVGVHLVLTSEWETMKWRPLTCAPSLQAPDGNFFPTVWDDGNFPPGSNLLKSDWKLAEVEAELRAQIELARREIPGISHLTDHMAFTRAAPELRAVAEKLAQEYGLKLHEQFEGLRFAGTMGEPEEKGAALIAILEKLTPGTWIVVDHPGLDTAELRALGHPGYRNVAADRAGVTAAFTSPKVKEVVRRRKIRLIRYRDLANQ